MKRRPCLLRRARGTTLVELLVAMGIIVTVTSTLAAAMSTGLKTQGGVREDGLAINELRKGLGWFADDVMMASGTDLVDGAQAASRVTLTWTDQFQGGDVAHTCVYSVSGDELVRACDGHSIAVARRVLSASFTRAGRAITAQVTVRGKHGAARVLSAPAFMRPGE